MSQKKLQTESEYNQYDLDGDGVVSDSELEAVAKIHETEMKEEKADAQRKMAWIALISMLVFTALVFLPIFPDTRIKALADLFFIILYRHGRCCRCLYGYDCLYVKKINDREIFNFYSSITINGLCCAARFFSSNRSTTYRY